MKNPIIVLRKGVKNKKSIDIFDEIHQTVEEISTLSSDVAHMYGFKGIPIQESYKLLSKVIHLLNKELPNELISELPDHIKKVLPSVLQIEKVKKDEKNLKKIVEDFGLNYNYMDNILDEIGTFLKKEQIIYLSKILKKPLEKSLNNISDRDLIINYNIFIHKALKLSLPENIEEVYSKESKQLMKEVMVKFFKKMSKDTKVKKTSNNI